jgi:tRNA threonylcarbamoyladenosine biosynthesis protein TsaE
LYYTSHSPEETENIAALFAKKLKGGDIVALFGDLGAGKTCFVRGMASGLGLDPTDVSSPTFALMNLYENRLAHFDMYRIGAGEPVDSTGFFDFADIIRVVEWAENITEYLTKETIKITINKTDENTREIEIEDRE